MDRVVLAHQSLGIQPDHPRDAADVTARVEVTATCRKVAALDPPDDRLADAGLLADLRNGETGLAARLRQGITNAHAAPPLTASTAGRRGSARSGRNACAPGVREPSPSVDMPAIRGGNTG